ncbi:MAG: hypothetical protein M5R36_20385 [Deltaproteobacteria bacterium]|nr:hypothetical protein [Deltaproteobacteria bacterium]
MTFDPPLAGAAEVYYFGPDALPTTSRNITGDTPSNGEGTLHATDTKGQAISYYLAINVDVDSDVDLIGTIFENEDDAESDFVRESDVMPQLYPNTVSIANVYFPKADYPSDPTRPWCTQ